MKSLFKVLWEFLRSLFGGKKDPNDGGGNGKDNDKDPTQGGGQPSLNPPTQWDLVRFDVGTYDTLGKLSFQGKFICYTLESSRDRADLGKYNLVLRKSGGLHATYGYRFGNMHKGMIQLDIPGSQNFRYLKIGNSVDDTDGSILVGKVINNRDKPQERREVWHSQDSYQLMYPQIADRIAAGEKMTLNITLDKEG